MNIYKKFVFKAIAYIIIQSFLLLDTSFAGVGLFSFQKPKDTLSPELQISNQGFENYYKKFYELQNSEKSFIDTNLLDGKKSQVLEVLKKIEEKNKNSNRKDNLTLKSILIPLLTPILIALSYSFGWAGEGVIQKCLNWFSNRDPRVGMGGFELYEILGLFYAGLLGLGIGSITLIFMIYHIKYFLMIRKLKKIVKAEQIRNLTYMEKKNAIEVLQYEIKRSFLLGHSFYSKVELLIQLAGKEETMHFLIHLLGKKFEKTTNYIIDYDAEYLIENYFLPIKGIETIYREVGYKIKRKKKREVIKSLIKKIKAELEIEIANTSIDSAVRTSFEEKEKSDDFIREKQKVIKPILESSVIKPLHIQSPSFAGLELINQAI